MVLGMVRILFGRVYAGKVHRNALLEAPRSRWPNAANLAFYSRPYAPPRYEIPKKADKRGAVVHAPPAGMSNLDLPRELY